MGRDYRKDQAIGQDWKAATEVQWRSLLSGVLGGLGEDRMTRLHRAFVVRSLVANGATPPGVVIAQPTSAAEVSAYRGEAS